ncbi:helix-turn-helix domain-containing protein [Vibrio comitans]
MVPLVNVALVRAALESYKKITNRPIEVENFGLSTLVYEQKGYFFPSKPFSVFLSFVHHSLDDFQLYRFYEHLCRSFAIPLFISKCPRKPMDVYESMRFFINIGQTETPSAKVTLEHDDNEFWVLRDKVIKNVADDGPSNLFFFMFIKVAIDVLTKQKIRALRIKSPSPSITPVLSPMVSEPANDVISTESLAGICFSKSLLEEKVVLEEHKFASNLGHEQEMGLIDSVKMAMDSYIGTQNYNIETIADTLGVSIRQLQYKLEEHGTTFKELKDEVMLVNTQLMIQGTSQSLSNIATQLGFSSISQFSRSIKRLTGVSPKEYKKQLLGSRYKKHP